ncbi:MAG: hypothetical protein IPK71_12980 [Myxococcales bacterium]|nr:hypothetical protein [Myxococcales bacterium]MBL9112920.1 hypothetical protein [Myxococcales bacterium]
MRRLLPYALVTAALALGAGCGKKDPPPAQGTPKTDASIEPPALGSQGPQGFVMPPKGFVPDDTPDAGEPYGKVAEWSTGTLPGTKITYKYPSDVFLMDEDKTSTLLTSPISVESIPDDAGNAPPPYQFRIRISVKPLGAVDAAKAEKMPTMFPDGKVESFVEATGLAKKLVVANHAAYMQRAIVHGFNASVVVVDLGPKRSLVARIETAGEELKSRISPSNWHPESWQLGLADKVLSTLVDPQAKAPPKGADAGK